MMNILWDMVSTMTWWTFCEIWWVLWHDEHSVRYGEYYDMMNILWDMVSTMTWWTFCEIWWVLWHDEHSVRYGEYYDMMNTLWDMVSTMTWWTLCEIWWVLWHDEHSVRYGEYYDMMNILWDMVSTMTWWTKLSFVTLKFSIYGHGVKAHLQHSSYTLLPLLKFNCTDHTQVYIRSDCWYNIDMRSWVQQGRLRINPLDSSLTLTIWTVGYYYLRHCQQDKIDWLHQ